MGNGRGASPFVKVSTLFFCLMELRGRVHACACMCVRVCVRACVVCACACVYACACARPCKNVKNPQKNAKKYTPPMRKKIVFFLRRHT